MSDDISIVGQGSRQFRIDWKATLSFVENSYSLGIYAREAKDVLLSGSEKIKLLDGDVGKIRKVARHQAEIFCAVRRDAARRGILHGEDLEQELLNHARQRILDRREIQKKQQNLARESAAAVSSDTRFWDIVVGGLEFTRDASAGILLVGATLISGGAAVAAVAVGSSITAGGTYQDARREGKSEDDARNLAAASGIAAVANSVFGKGGSELKIIGGIVVAVAEGCIKYRMKGKGTEASAEAMTKILLLLVPAPEKAKSALEKQFIMTANVVIPGGVSVAQSVIEGKSFEDALAAGAIEVGGAGLKQVLSKPELTNWLRTTALPAVRMDKSRAFSRNSRTGDFVESLLGRKASKNLPNFGYISKHGTASTAQEMISDFAVRAYKGPLREGAAATGEALGEKISGKQTQESAAAEALIPTDYTECQAMVRLCVSRISN